MTETLVYRNTNLLPSHQASRTHAKPRRHPRSARTRTWAFAAGVVALAVVAWASLPHLRQEIWPRRLLPAVEASSAAVQAGDYTFMQGSMTSPVRYDPCEPLKYQVNDALAPPGGERLLRRAISEVQALTGLRFEYDGTTSRIPESADESSVSLLPISTQPITLAWATPRESHRLTGDVAGFGGSVSQAGSTGEPRYITGAVALDAHQIGRLLERPGGTTPAEAIMFHELGHLVGLGHVSDPSQIMYPQISTQHDFGTGDRAGLAILGQGSCHSFM